MSDHPTPPSRDTGTRLMRDVLTLVLAGAALGAAFNHLQLATGERGKGLAWIKQERALASLEALLADSAAAAAATPAPATPAPRRAAADTAATPAAAPASARPDPAASGPPARSTAAVAPEPARRADASIVPPSDAAPASVAPGPDVPAIPDTREPLEVQYPLVKKLHDAGAAVFVDARTPEEFAAGHIPGAINVPFDDVFKQPDRVRRVDTGGRPIVTYCGGGDCELSKSLAWAFLEGGHRKVLVFMGGLPGWQDPGNPVSTGATR